MLIAYQVLMNKFIYQIVMIQFILILMISCILFLYSGL